MMCGSNKQTRATTTPIHLSEIIDTFKELLTGNNLPERVAVCTTDLRALLDAASHSQQNESGKS